MTGEMREMVRRAMHDEPSAQEVVAIERLTSPELWGGAVAYTMNRCVVLYGVPVWIMPNGWCRVGRPDAAMVKAGMVPGIVRGIRDEGSVSA